MIYVEIESQAFHPADSNRDPRVLDPETRRIYALAVTLIQRSALIATGLGGLLLLPVLAQQKTPASKTGPKPVPAKTTGAKTTGAKTPGKQAPAVKPTLKRVGPGKMEVGDGKAAVKWSQTAETFAGKTTTFPKGKKTQLALQDAIAMGSASKAAVKVGGSTLRLLDSVTFAIRKVGAETSVVTVLDVDLEVERGTVLELEYGSVRVVVITGSCTMRPSTQPISNQNLPPGAWGDSTPRKTVQTNRVEVSSPGSNSVISASISGGQQISVVRTASGSLSISVPPGAAPVTFTIVTTDPATGKTTTTTQTVKAGDPGLSSTGGGVVTAEEGPAPGGGGDGDTTGTPDGTTSQSDPITGGNR